MPSNTPWTGLGDLAALGTTALTTMAETFEQFPGDPGAQFFDVRTVNSSTVIVERMAEGVGIAPLVNPGFPDVLTDNAQAERRTVTPAYTRESDYIPNHVINDLRKLGTPNEKEGLEWIAKRMQRLVNRSNALFAVLRYQCLLGAIAYTDPRTNITINVSSNLPASNLIDLNAGPAARRWDNLNTSLPITDLRRFRQVVKNQGKTEPTDILMSSDLLTIIEENAQILARQEAFNQTGFVTYSGGKLTQIAGMNVQTVDMIYQDPFTGRVRKVWPINKVWIGAKNNPQYPGMSLGYMDWTIGEAANMKPGIWSYTNDQNQPPAPPGRSLQVGNSGLPWLLYPNWTGILTVGDANALRALLSDSVSNTF